jgi:hypothetical protein
VSAVNNGHVQSGMERLLSGKSTVSGRSVKVADVSLATRKGRRPDFFTNWVSSFALTWRTFHFPWHSTTVLHRWSLRSTRDASNAPPRAPAKEIHGSPRIATGPVIWTVLHASIVPPQPSVYRTTRSRFSTLRKVSIAPRHRASIAPPELPYAFPRIPCQAAPSH